MKAQKTGLNLMHSWALRMGCLCQRKCGRPIGQVFLKTNSPEANIKMPMRAGDRNFTPLQLIDID